MDSKDHADRLFSASRRGVVEGATVDFARRPTTMIIIGIVLALVGLAYLCWLLFALAVYALPLSLASPLGLPPITAVRGRSERSSSG